MNIVEKYAGDLISLFFPQVCYACGDSLMENEDTICTSCLYQLPYTNFQSQPDNPLARQFWGRFSFRYAIACLYFYQHSKVQTLIHQMKYNNKPAVGEKIGRLYGMQIKSLVETHHTDLIVPVPLHKTRQRKRGYNQSEHFALGLSSSLGIPVDTVSLERILSTETQTHRTRFSRYENMREAFVVRHPENLKGRHLLLVDDVITTGATLEGCALALAEIPGITISIAAMAFTV